MIDVAVIGADDDVVAANFDDATNTWLLRTSSGGERRARVVIDERTLHLAAEWDPAFDPTGKRIAVIGDRAAHVLPKLAGAQATLFDCPATFQTQNTKRRWLPRRPPGRPHLVTSPVAQITSKGVRTADGTEHVVDAIIYATASTTKTGLPDDALVGANGLTIQQAWRDAATAYYGIAVHGFPNYFLLHGPDSPVNDDQARYIADCLGLMKHHNATRIEVRRSAQQQYAQRARIKPPTMAFDLTDEAHDIYDGPATLSLGDDEHTVRARLTGHLDPIDGKYHWQGTVFGAQVDLPKRPVAIATDARSAQARITEQTPWGSYSIAGIGAPPYEVT